MSPVQFPPPCPFRRKDLRNPREVRITQRQDLNPSCAERAMGRVSGPHYLWLLSEGLLALAWPPGPPPLRAHLGQPRLGIQDTQEAVGLVYEEV